LFVGYFCVSLLRRQNILLRHFARRRSFIPGKPVAVKTPVPIMLEITSAAALATPNSRFKLSARSISAFLCGLSAQTNLDAMRQFADCRSEQLHVL